MDMKSGVSHLFRFAGFAFHASTGELQREGGAVQLPEQACRVLLALLEAEGEVVSREELRAALWPGRSYGDFEGGLNTAIFKLRQALDDDGAEPRIVGTLPRRGYRMLVPVEKVTATRKAADGLEEKSPPGEAGDPGYSPQERFPAVGPIWAPAPSGGADPGAGAVSSRPGRNGPALRRKGRIAWGALLLILGIGGMWIGADPELRQAAALRMRRMVVPIQALAGKVVRNRLGMAFVRIPAGSFTMGTDDLPVEWGFMNFRPAHRVTLSRPFLLQTTEVTVGQFKAFVAATNYRTDGEKTDGIRVSKGLQPTAASQGYLFDRSMKRLDATWKNPYFPQEDDCPVVGVSWNDTQAFIDWLNEKEPGRGYRLPTEAEWEYACRAGATGTAPPSAIEDIAWVSDNSTFRTHAVGSKASNAFGLHDMLGNAWEWCQDWYLYGYLAELDRDPQGPTWGTMKVIRGGGWRNLHAADKLLLVTRYYAGVREGSDDIGFRLAASADGP